MDKSIDLSKFELLDRIGVGSFGEVFTIRDQKSHQIYAMKVSLKKSRDLTDEVRRDLNQSVKISSKLNYPSIAKFIGYNPKNMKNVNRPTIVTEYMPNGSLAKIFKQDKDRLISIGYNNTKRYINIIGIAKGMAKLHESKAFHGNLDPNNVLLDCYLYPKITDINFLSEDNDNSSSINNDCICYKAPEVLDECEYTQESDVFSFAFIAYQLITGEKPFDRLTPYQIIQNVQKGNFPKFKKNVNKSLQNLIEKCWSIDPSDRPTFSEIVEELEGNKSIIIKVENKKEYRNYIKYLDSNSEELKPKPSKVYMYSNPYQEEEKEEEEEKVEEEDANEDSQEDSETENSDDDDEEPEAKAEPKTRICPKEIFEKLSKNAKKIVKSADDNNKDTQDSVGLFLIKESKNNKKLRPIGFKYFLASIENGCQLAISHLFNNLRKKDLSVVAEFVKTHSESTEDRMIKAIYLLKINEYEEARKILLDLRKKKFAKSCFYLGRIYERGWGVTQDKKKADQYYKEHDQLLNENVTPNDKSSEVDPDTLYQKGMDCKTGNNCTINIKNAIKFFNLAASKNHIPSMKELYEIYYNGIQSVEVDYEKALKYVKKAADEGDVDSMRNTAAMYENEEGTELNLEEACKYYKLAADKGDVDSMNKYGLMLDQGEGTKVDKKKACKYYKMAADEGNQFAMYNYALMLINGEGVKVDVDKGIEYLENASKLGYKVATKELKKVKLLKLKKDADDGDSQAMLQYAKKLIEGKGKDYATAIEYLKKAQAEGEKNAGKEIKRVQLLKLKDEADNGNVKSMLKYAKMLEKGQNVKMNVELSKEYYSNAIDILKEKVDDGDTKSMVQYGRLLELGIGVKMNKKEAAKLYKAAADQKDADGCLSYAFLYNSKAIQYNKDKNAHKTPQISEKEFKKAQQIAFEYFTIASENGKHIATLHLGLILEHGNGVPKNVKKAFKCYKKAADNGCVLAMTNLARCYDYGIGTDEDKKLAFELYEKAAKKGNARAMINLGTCYENGIGVEKNEKLAIVWYKKAIQKATKFTKNFKDGKIAQNKLDALKKKMAKSTNDDDESDNESDDEIEFTSSDEDSDEDDD